MTLSRAKSGGSGLMPITFSPSLRWEGNDGSWSTFVIRVGNPAQTFRVLPSTCGQETWVPIPEGCLNEEPVNCGELRGVQSFQNSPSPGFRTNQSSSWEYVNLFKLGLVDNLFDTGNGVYGFDTVGLQIQNSGGVTLDHQVVAGIATKAFMYGVFPLGIQPTNFSDFNEPQPSFLFSLRNQSLIPSLSYSYSAGASYRHSLGSLIFGGYDASQILHKGQALNFKLDGFGNLRLAFQAVSVSDSLLGVVSLLPRGIWTFIESTVPDLWLPREACDLFEAAFGLTFDNSTERYIVNDTIHNRLLALNPSITFKMGMTLYGNASQNIILPYASFDIQAKYPIYPNTTNYFPIRRAANESQYTVGRIFLQETYLVVDYERSNFSITQRSFDTEAKPQIISILPEGTIQTPPLLTKESIIGIAVGVAVTIILLFAAGLFLRRYKKRRADKSVSKLPRSEKEQQMPEVSEEGIYEAHGREYASELDNGAVQELGGTEVPSELMG